MAYRALRRDELPSVVSSRRDIFPFVDIFLSIALDMLHVHIEINSVRQHGTVMEVVRGRWR